MSKSDYLENKVLDHILGGGDFSRPSTVHVALFTAAPNDAGGGTEVSGGSYARAAVTNNATNWPAAADGSKENGSDIVFAEPTADWGEVSHFALFDSAGNMLYHGALNASKIIQTGDPVRFPAGQLVITED